MLVGETYCVHCQCVTETIETEEEFLCVVCSEEK